MEDDQEITLTPCSEMLLEYRHRDTGDAQVRPVRCGERDLCVTCGIGYGLSKGAELVSLFETLLDGETLLGYVPSVKAFAVVLTLPEVLSHRLDALVARRHVGSLRKALSELTSAVRETCETWLGSGLGIKVHWHWWHSSDPLSGPHWHAHVLIPNLHQAPDGSFGILRARGKVPEPALEALARLWSARVRGTRCVQSWGDDLPDRFTVDYRFLTRWSGEHSVGHRARYDARHPWQDVETFVIDAGLPDRGGMNWFLQRLVVLQGVQLARSLGWLSNAKAKDLGLRRVESDDPYERVHGVVYRLDLEGFDAAGVWVWRLDLVMGTRRRCHWPREGVNLDPTVHARRWTWAGGPDPGGGVRA